MNKVQRQIQDNIMQPMMDKMAAPTFGTIKNFDSLTRTGNVTYKRSATKDEEVAKNVPMMGFSGIKQADPLPGDEVLLLFVGSNYSNPVIIGQVDSKHGLITRNQKESHFRSGGNASDVYTTRKGETWNDRGLI